MAALAEFEGYADEFAVSEADLEAHGFGDAPRFGAFVADDGGPELPSHAPAMALYRQAGGQPDARWQSWTRPLPGSGCACE